VFYLMGGGSFGLQAGGEISEIMLVIRTEKGLDAVLKNRFKVGADATVAFGTIGKGLAASTTSNVGADIVTFSRAKGLAAGISIDGAVLQPRDRWNDTYYAKPVTPREILAGNVDGMGSDALRQALKAAEAP
ncbi:MAG: lipid-binding SYLF domain-containing protein, partial [Ferrovibrionaceae bacterium]